MGGLTLGLVAAGAKKELEGEDMLGTVVFWPLILPCAITFRLVKGHW